MSVNERLALVTAFVELGWAATHVAPPCNCFCAADLIEEYPDLHDGEPRAIVAAGHFQTIKMRCTQCGNVTLEQIDTRET